jgi:hypothetical protein
MQRNCSIVDTAKLIGPSGQAYIAACLAAEAERIMISQVEKTRYLELVSFTRQFLEEEIKIRESLPEPNHAGVAEERRVEFEAVRALLKLQGNWHPNSAIFVKYTGATEGYAEIFRFPCCGIYVKDFRSTGEGDPPSQFRSDGCVPIPNSVQYSYHARSNPFTSVLVWKYRELTDAAKS